MERTKLQQAELDRIERKILIIIFGSEDIPETTAGILNAFSINPNIYIRDLENKLIPIMKDNGDIDGVLLNKMIRMWKPNLADYINLPSETFRLSDRINQLVSLLLPGIEVY